MPLTFSPKQSHRLLLGDTVERLREIPDDSVHCCVTSPPYWGLRDYGHDGQIGLEPTPEAYVARMVEVFREVRRVLRSDGTCWLNVGDTYSSKGLLGMPWRLAFALRDSGWLLRQDIIFAKPNPMPESVRDRCTRSHEYVFLLSKGRKYFFDSVAISEQSAQPDRVRRDRFGGNKYQSGVKHSDGSVFLGSTTRNRRSVWNITLKPYKGAHFATMPIDLAVTCIKAGASAAGCCSKCGGQIERVVKRDRKPTRPGADTKVTGDSMIDGNRDPQRHVTAVTTEGWAVACTCGSAAMPCTVLDPFGGSGTTSAAAKHLGHDSIYIELNPDYLPLARQRIDGMAPGFLESC